jgi:hypothetical protein
MTAKTNYLDFVRQREVGLSSTTIETSILTNEKTKHWKGIHRDIQQLNASDRYMRLLMGLRLRMIIQQLANILPIELDLIDLISE